MIRYGPSASIGNHHKLIPDDANYYANLGTSYVKMYFREKSPTWRRMAVEA